MLKSDRPLAVPAALFDDLRRALRGHRTHRQPVSFHERDTRDAALGERSAPGRRAGTVTTAAHDGSVR